MSNHTERGHLFDALTMTMSALIVKFLGFLYKVPISQLLGDEGMGYYNSALTVYAIFYILSASAIPKAFSIVLTRGRISNSKRAYKVGLVLFSTLFIGLGLFFSTVLWYFSKEISSFVGVLDSSYAIQMIGPAVVISSLGALCRGYLLSYNKLLPVAISEAIEAILKLLCGLYFVIFAKNYGLSLIKMSAFATYGITIGSFVSFLFLFIIILICRKPQISFGKLPFSFSSFFVSIFKITIPLTLTSLLISISNILDLGLINKGLLASGMSKEGAIAQYGNFSTLVLPLFSFVTSLVSAYSLSIFPKLTQAHEGKDEKQFNNLLNNASTLLLSFLIFVSLGFYFYGEDYFLLIFPKSDILQGTILLKIMSPAVIFIGLSTLMNTALEANGNTIAPLLTIGIGTLIKIPASYLSIAKFGIEGSAFSSVLSYGIGFMISYYMILKKLKLSVLKINNLLRSLLNCGICFSLSLLLKKYLLVKNQSPFIRIIPMIVCATLFLVIEQLFLSCKQNNTQKLTFSTKL